ncbi:porin family protein [Kaistella palustris]|uniref:porin family protein n=1 Tax=Kaistella palustris TaxID=493376 RepID=UPI0004017120|nr:porin family protein [Kaistella palustris]
MKKIFLIGAIALCGAINAQTFGAKAGMNISSLSNFDGSKSKVGLNAGIFMNAPLAADFSIQPELLYNMKGAKESGGDGTINIDYISVPVMFQYNATPQFYLEAGPEFGFVVGSKFKGSGLSVDFKDGTESFDVGLGLGAGYYFIPQLGLTARYVAGLMNVIKDNGGDSVKNNVFQVGLAYKFVK